MSPTPEEQRVAELLHRLAEHAASEPPPVAEARVVAPPPRTRPPWTTVLVAAVVLAVVGAGTSLLLRDRTDDRVIMSAAETASLAGGTTERLAPSGLAGRTGAASVWTGKELLVWGGSPVGPVPGKPLADGAALDPLSNRWRPIPPAPIAGRSDMAVAWTGREMLVSLGTSATGQSLVDGAAFDPQTNRWRLLASSPFGGVFKPAAVWTGAELLVVATTNSQPTSIAYDPATDRWRRLTAPPGSLVMPYPQVVWTGTEAVYVLFPSLPTVPVDGLVAGPAGGPVGAPPVGGSVSTAPAGPSPTLGGSSAAVPTTLSPPPPDLPAPLPAMRGPNSGMFLASYSPVTDRWTRLPDVALRDGTIPRLAWTGEEILAMQRSDPGAAFDPKSQTWRPIAGSPPDESGFAIHAVWTGRMVLLWSGGKNGLAYEPQTNAWSTFDAGGLPVGPDPVVAWADGYLIGWSGTDGGDPKLTDEGIRYRPPRR